MSDRIFVLVTGASRGFGRCMAEEFVCQVAPLNPVDLVLVARSAAGLQSTARTVDEIARSFPDGKESWLDKKSWTWEILSTWRVAWTRCYLESVAFGFDPSRYGRAVLINNAASLGDICYANELPSLATLRSNLDFNVTSAVWLSSRFSAVFGARGADSERKTTDMSAGEGRGGHDSNELVRHKRDPSKNVVVNISSTAALKPIKQKWCGYGAGKAARDMFHRVLAMEQDAIGGLKVLNYAPGVMSTDMARQLRSSEQFEDDVRSGHVKDPKLSAETCVKLVLRGVYTTGAHVDVCDAEGTM